MSERRWRALPLVGALPVVGLLAAVLGVGAVAMYAESQKDWGSYLVMERAMTASAAVVLPLLGLALVGGFVVVSVAPRFER